MNDQDNTDRGERFRVELASEAGVERHWTHYDCAKCSAASLAEWEGVDEDIAEILTHESVRPRFDVVQDGVIHIVRAVNLNPGAEPEDMVALRIYCTSKRILSLTRQRVVAVKDTRKRLERGDIELCPPAVVLDTIVTAITKRIADVVDDIGERLATLEERMLTNKPEGSVRELADIRREIAQLRRHLSPQRAAMRRSWQDAPRFFSHEVRHGLRESADFMARHDEEFESLWEQAKILHDEIEHHQNARLNRNMYLMSLLAAIFLPLSFLTGLLGINVGGMPGASWEHAFWVVSAMIGVLVLVEVWILKRRDLL